MRRLSIICSLIVVTMLGVDVALSAAEGRPCGDRDYVVSQLYKEADETLVAQGLRSMGFLVEVFVAPDGTWTLLETMPNGVTCIIAAGVSWHTVSKPTPTPNVQVH